MKSKLLYASLVSTGVTAIVVGLFVSTQTGDSSDSSSISRSNNLIRPALAGLNAQVDSNLREKAAMTAYIKLNPFSDEEFELVRAEYNNPPISTEVDNTPSFDGHIDVPGQINPPSVLVRQDGWIIAYFLEFPSVTDGSNTNSLNGGPEDSLDNIWPYVKYVVVEDDILSRAMTRIIEKVLNRRINRQEIRYFSYSFPNATKLMVIQGEKTNSVFNVLIPDEFTIHDAAYSTVHPDFPTSGDVSGRRLTLARSSKGEMQLWTGSLILLYSE